MIPFTSQVLRTKTKLQNFHVHHYFKANLFVSVPSREHSSRVETIPQIPPSVRRLLTEYSIEQKVIKPTGPGKRILKGDVLMYINSNKLSPKSSGSSPSAPVKEQPPQPSKSAKGQPVLPSFTDIPASNMRQVIAKRLTESKFNTPHLYITKHVIVNNLLAIRKKLNQEADLKLSVNDFLIKAIAISLKRVPQVNVLWNPDTYTATAQTQVDISVAVAIEGGLITPIVFGADKKGLKEINEIVKELAEKAKKGSLKPTEYQGGTFSISNMGMYGVTQFTAVINPPQAAILSVGSTDTKLSIDEVTNKVSAQNIMIVTLNFDGRAIEPESASQFLDELAYCLEQPLQLC